MFATISEFWGRIQGYLFGLVHHADIGIYADFEIMLTSA
jgi:hypothetical protein